MKRETLAPIIVGLIKVLTRTEYYGVENVPTQGPIILALNHMSQIDSLLVLCAPARPDVTGFVADKYQKNLFMNWFLNTMEIIWLDRSKADFAAFRAAADVLKTGRALGIAPEGTRSSQSQLLQGKSGTALLAIRTGVPVVPVGITGTNKGIRNTLLLRRPRFTVTFGEPLVFPPLDRDGREEALQRATDEIMCQIAALLPQSYWGFYKDHPRLKEILVERTR